MSNIKPIVWAVLGILLAAGAANVASADTPHRCAADALKRAPALLAHHLPDIGHPFSFDTPVEQITPLANPAAPRQTFDVLQVWALVYKAKYRLRFIYARLDGSCLLMGQEVLEYARL